MIFILTVSEWESHAGDCYNINIDFCNSVQHRLARYITGLGQSVLQYIVRHFTSFYEYETSFVNI